MPGRVAAGETLTLTSSGADMRAKEEENLSAMINFLVDEVKSLKLQLEQQSSSSAGVAFDSRSGKSHSEHLPYYLSMMKTMRTTFRLQVLSLVV